MLGSEFKDIDVRRDEIAKDLGESVSGAGSEGQEIVDDLRGGCPFRDAEKKILAQIVGANVNLDFAIGGGTKIARGNDFAVLDEDDGVTGDFDFAQEMGVEEYGGAALAFIADDVADKMAAHRIEARSGLIEEDEFRLVNEGLGKADALHHAFGEAAETAVSMRREANEVDVGRNAIVKLRLR